MQIRYERVVDASYIKLSSKQPKGAIEVEKGVILHITKDSKIVGLEIRRAGKKLQ